MSEAPRLAFFCVCSLAEYISWINKSKVKFKASVVAILLNVRRRGNVWEDFFFPPPYESGSGVSGCRGTLHGKHRRAVAVCGDLRVV